MLILRRSTKADIPTIQRFTDALQEHLYSSNPDTWKRNPTTQQYRESIEREATDPEAYTLIAELDGEPVGYMSSRILDRGEPSPRRVGVVMNAYTKPRYRSRGVATALLKKILEYFEAEEAEQVTLRYVIGNKEAENYWTKLGFKPIIMVANTTMEELTEKLG